MFLPRPQSKPRDNNPTTQPLTSIDELDDPLVVYESQIRDLLMSYQQSYELERKLIHTLQQATEAFERDERYRNCPRYLRLWLIYASFIKSPASLYQHLQDQNIGTHLAMFYEQVAQYYVKEHRLLDAERLLQRGLNQRAQPFARLERLYRSLRHHKTLPHSEPSLWREIAIAESTWESIPPVPARQPQLPAITGDENSSRRQSPATDTSCPLREGGIRTMTTQEVPVPPDSDKSMVLGMLDWLEAQVNHSGRVAVLRECYRFPEETSFEELRVRAMTRRRKRKRDTTGSRLPCFKRLHQNTLPLPQPQSHPQPRPQPQPQLQPQHQPQPQPQPSSSAKRPPVRKGPLSDKTNRKIRHRSQPIAPDCRPTPSPSTSQSSSQPLRKPAPTPTSTPVSDSIVKLPVDAATVRRCVVKLALESPDFFDLSPRLSKQRSRLDRVLPGNKAHVRLLLGDPPREWQVLGKLGQGGMGKVFLVRTREQTTGALKVEAPPNVWEFYILHRLHQDPSATHIIHAHALYYYKDTSYMLLEHARQGTVLNAFNTFRVRGESAMPEILVVFFALQLLQGMLAMHRANIIHCDLKLDNVMVDFAPVQNLASNYRASDLTGWGHKSIKFIDLGRAVDLTLFDTIPRFVATWPAIPTDLPQIRLQQPWFPWAIDYWGLAAMIHLLLFGQPLSTVPTTNSQWRPRLTWRRYWHIDLWSRMFHILLNPTFNPSHPSPINRELEHARQLLISTLENDTETDGKLRSLVLQLENNLSVSTAHG